MFFWDPSFFNNYNNKTVNWFPQPLLKICRSFLKYKFISFNCRLITILYWLCHTSTWIRHRYTRVPHPEPPLSSLPVPSLWVVPVHQPQASSIMHWTWTGDSFHIWYYVKRTNIRIIGIPEEEDKKKDHEKICFDF